MFFDENFVILGSNFIADELFAQIYGCRLNGYVCGYGHAGISGMGNRFRGIPSSLNRQMAMRLM